MLAGNAFGIQVPPYPLPLQKFTGAINLMQSWRNIKADDLSNRERLMNY